MIKASEMNKIQNLGTLQAALDILDGVPTSCLRVYNRKQLIEIKQQLQTLIKYQWDDCEEYMSVDDT